MSARLWTHPITIKSALKWNASVHRKLKKLQGGMWAVAVRRADRMVGVAIVGRPNARVLDDGTRLQVLRVAVMEGDAAPTGHRGACSMLYGACARAARAMGARDLWTYVYCDESGVSLRAAGWIEDGMTDGGEWGERPSRQRELALDPRPKRRFFAPWSERLRAAQAGR